MKNKNRWKSIVIAMMALAVFTMAGCQSKPEDVVATLDDQKITFGFANFFARYTQANYDAMYAQVFGKDVWSQKTGKDNQTIEAGVKQDILKMIEELYILDNHKDEYKVSLTKDETKSIEAAADKFMKSNTKDAIEEIGATKEYIIEMLRLMTIKDKMYSAMIADVDLKVKDEEKNQAKIKYAKISTKTKKDKNKQDVELTKEEVKTLRKDVAELAKKVQNGADFDKAATDIGHTASEATYGSDDETLPAELKKAANALEEGKTSDVIEIEDSLYVVKMESKLDKKATADKETSIIKERKETKYKEIYDSWAKKVKFKVNNSVWDDVKFDRLFTQVSDTQTADINSEAGVQTQD
ncbi:peptidylprolyl isomerase [Anaerosacchariphilus polymeriproducens]|uniref:PpiC domain-containing protein n=1 Tax=Anaerosacchariphilus polymeriproducens TaxID=1812858 RepID=A0A371AZZ7_9FIRM|nr:peptidyl-prolyl cis-trans isomerase [Anaerosacchariphilus polymeriproducens]RDU25113.1 hypothetical protein DWV06_01035 [Anaerosacchariphilus polymeriproducens]